MAITEEFCGWDAEKVFEDDVAKVQPGEEPLVVIVGRFSVLSWSHVNALFSEEYVHQIDPSVHAWSRWRAPATLSTSTAYIEEAAPHDIG